MRQRTLLRVSFIALGVAACCAVSTPACAWGLKTHLWIAEKVLSDVASGCDVDLNMGGGKRYALSREVCDALRQHPAEFRAGVLGPDVFPDFVVGQVTTHPGTNAEIHAHSVGSKWTTGQYMSHLLEHARTPAELAFAYGYLVHAAGDVFAHTYVNNYAGDVFDLSDAERRVELRHFVLEKYIEARTPLPATLSLDARTVKVPTSFVTSELVFDGKVQEQYRKVPAATHLRMMQDVYERNRTRDDRALVAKAGEVAQRAAARLAVLRGDLGAEKRALKRAELGEAFKARSLDKALDRLRELQSPEAIELLRALPSSARAQVEQAAPAPLPGAGLNGVVERLRSVENAPDEAQADARSVQELDAVLAMLDSEGAVPAAHGQAEAARDKLLETDAFVRAAESMRRAGQLNGAADALSTARSELSTAKQAYADNLRQRIAQLVDKERELDATAKQADATYGFLQFRQGMRGNRIEGIELATAAYVDTSIAAALDVMNGRASPVSAYDAWRKCWGMVYAGVPHQWNVAACEIRADIDQGIDALIARLPSGLRELANRYNRVKAELVLLAREEALHTLDMAISAATNDAATIRFLQMIGHRSTSAADLVDAYQRSANDGKDLLLLPDIENLVNEDLNTRDGTAHPDDFQALRHSVILAKLSLLSLDTVNQMVRDHVGSDRSPLFPDGEPLYPHGGSRSSILPLMVKSIDGNHQWQAYGIPYPRARREERVFDAALRRYGYNVYTEPGYGMRLFADPAARDKLFAKLFPTPFVGAINRHLGDTKLNPFVTCAEVPFPVTTLPDGRPADGDNRCPAPQPARQPELEAAGASEPVDAGIK